MKSLELLPTIHLSIHHLARFVSSEIAGGLIVHRRTHTHTPRVCRVYLGFPMHLNTHVLGLWEDNFTQNGLWSNQDSNQGPSCCEVTMLLNNSVPQDNILQQCLELLYLKSLDTIRHLKMAPSDHCYSMYRLVAPTRCPSVYNMPYNRPDIRYRYTYRQLDKHTHSYVQTQRVQSHERGHILSHPPHLVLLHIWILYSFTLYITLLLLLLLSSSPSLSL